MTSADQKERSVNKTESVAERAVRGALAGYVYAERKVVKIVEESVTMEGTDVYVVFGYRATVEYFVPISSIDTMLKREKADRKEARAGKKRRRTA